jgi:acyl dehydratase
MTDFHVAVGDSVTFDRTVSERDVYDFARITGDLSPNHVDQAYMERSPWGRRMAHGALLVGFISAASTLAIESCRSDTEETPVAAGFDNVRFLAPVFLGETVTVRYEIDRIDLDRRRSVAKVRVTNQDGALVAVADHILQWVRNAGGPVRK